jgi:squid-like protein
MSSGILPIDSRKVFIGNLAWGTDEHELLSTFRPFGAVSSVHVMNDPQTGRCRGFAFVSFAEAEVSSRLLLRVSRNSLAADNC